MLKPRILFILPNLSAGGAERNILDLGRRLVPDFDVHLALIRYSGTLISVVPEGIYLHDLGGRVRFLFQLVALTRLLSPGIVFSTIADVNLAVLMTKRFFPKTVRVVIRDAAMPLDLFRGRPWDFLLRSAYRRAYANADAVIALTERCRRDTVRELDVNEQKTLLIYNAISAERFGFRPASALRGSCGTVNLIAIGRLERQKAYDLLIQSLPRVLQNFPEIRLTVFGEGKERSRLQQMISQLHLGHIVTLAGYVPDPIAALREADLFVLCSHYEGMSNAMLEALCCGVPVLATNNRENSANEFIKDGINGFLVPELSVPALARGLIRAINEFPQMDRERISRDAHQRFSRDEYLARYRSLLQRVIGE